MRRQTISILGKAVVAAVLALAAVGAGVAAESPAKPEVIWNLGDLYASPEAWQSEYAAVDVDLKKITMFRGQLGKDAKTLADAFDLVSGLGKRIARLYVFGQLKKDEDTRIQSNLARFKQGSQLNIRYGESIAWIGPELIVIGEPRIESFIASEARLKVHTFALRDYLRGAQHTLSQEGEAILSAAALPLSAAQSIYIQMSSSDIPWPSIKIDGKAVTINNEGYGLHRQNADREVRKQVFSAFYKTWKQYESSLGQVLAAQVQGQVFNARMRKFGSAREAALFSVNLPVAIYDQLIAQTHAGLPTLYRYFQLRAKMLGIKDMAYYDIYPELVSLPQMSFPLEQSKRITRAALAPFGPDYIAALDKGFAGDWMHAYPQEGKDGGAYVFGAAYDVHPYVFLNHQNTFDSLSTFAHEWGHAVHSVLANASQPWETSGYATFVAEMASTINSTLLLQYLQAHAANDQERLYFLAQELEMYRATFFRQAMFGEFESRIHAAAEAGEGLTGERFTAIYLDLLRTYHGADKGVMTIDPAYALEWAYIPHFYRNFYVFQYATSVTASTAFATRLVSKDAAATQRAVIGMLRKGGSEYPHAMFVEAGVDLTTPAPYQAVIARMNTVMDEMERINGKTSK